MMEGFLSFAQRTIHETLGSTIQFSTLDGEAGIHQLQVGVDCLKTGSFCLVISLKYDAAQP